MITGAVVLDSRHAGFSQATGVSFQTFIHCSRMTMAISHTFRWLTPQPTYRTPEYVRKFPLLPDLRSAPYAPCGQPAVTAGACGQK